VTRQQFKQLRKALDLTQVQLAKEMGVTPTAVALWEQGKRSIRPPIARLLTLLNVLKHHKLVPIKPRREKS